MVEVTPDDVVCFQMHKGLTKLENNIQDAFCGVIVLAFFQHFKKWLSLNVVENNAYEI
jgi:hypothetical protein